MNADGGQFTTSDGGGDADSGTTDAAVNVSDAGDLADAGDAGSTIDGGSQFADAGIGTLDGGASDAGGTQDAGMVTFTNTVTGTIGGVAPTIRSALVYSATSQSSGQTVVYLVLANGSNLCADFTVSSVPASMSFLFIELYSISGSGQFISATPGTYTVVQGSVATQKFAEVSYEVENSTCGQASGVQATGGTVALDSINLAAGGGAEGTFTLMFGSDTVSGTFDAPYCLFGFPTTPICL
jgi:hypothetical protein